MCENRASIEYCAAFRKRGGSAGYGGAVVAVRAVNHAAELGLYLKDMGCH